MSLFNNQDFFCVNACSRFTLGIKCVLFVVLFGAAFSERMNVFIKKNLRFKKDSVKLTFFVLMCAC